MSFEPVTNASAAGKKPTNNVTVTLPNVRLSYPVLWAPQLMDEKFRKPTDVPKYSARFLIPLDSEAFTRVKKAVDDLAKTTWGRIPAGLKHCIHDGAEKAEEGMSEYAGMAYVNANSTRRPHVVGPDKSPVVEGEQNAPYAGCYVNAAVQLWVQNKPGMDKAIYASLVGVQFKADGEAFGHKLPAVDQIF